MVWMKTKFADQKDIKSKLKKPIDELSGEPIGKMIETH